MTDKIVINNKPVGPGHPVYVIAELSANHNQKLDQALELVRTAKEAGADAVKLQTYRPDTITIDSDKECFRVGGGTLWDGRTLYDLYKEAHTPWEWHPKLKKAADGLGIDLFSSPFDPTAVDFLAEMGIPAYKVASFEIVDIPLIEKIARTGKPMILSTGMATFAEIEEAVKAAVGAGAEEIALLKCTSAYPAPPESMNLRTIPHMAEAFGRVTGLSDHSLGIAAPAAAVALGACIIEKHLTLSRDFAGPDAAFSLEPDEFKAMVRAVRRAEKALGKIRYGPTEHQMAGLAFRRSLFAVRDIEKGEAFTTENVRSIRPGHGLEPKFLPRLLGSRAAVDIERGTPLAWSLVKS